MFLFLGAWLIYDRVYNYEQVCTQYKSKVKGKFHEIESINNFGATRNNYYIFLENGVRRNVNLELFATMSKGDILYYKECKTIKKDETD